VHSARSCHFSVKTLQLLNHFQCKSPWGLSLSVFRDIIIALQLLAFFAQNLALYNKNNRVLLSQALCLIGFLGNLMFKLHIIFVVNISLGKPITRSRLGQKNSIFAYRARGQTEKTIIDYHEEF